MAIQLTNPNLTSTKVTANKVEQSKVATTSSNMGIGSNTSSEGASFQAEFNKAQGEIDALKKSATSAQEKGDLEALKKVSKEFEEVFINMMLKAMRNTIEDGGLVEKSNQRGIFEGMLDEEFAKKMVENNGIGIQEMMVRQMSRYVESDKLTNPAEIGRASCRVRV